MNKNSIIYHIIISVLWLVALLPLKILYLISDALSFLARRVLHYRVEVVRKNLSKAFPNLNEKQLRNIEKEFYRYLCDTFVETIKLLHISDKQMRRRVEVAGVEVVEEYADEGRPIILFLGHYCNWEWVPALTLSIDRPIIMGALYKPLQDKISDMMMLKFRSRFDSICIPVAKAYRTLVELKKNEKPFMIGFIADQRPVGTPLHHWTTFMGQPTAFMAGGETIGDRVGARYVYLDIERISRGHYKLTFKKMTPSPDDTGPFPFTRLFFNMLENTIRRQPPYWLWSHNRWKAKPPTNL